MKNNANSIEQKKYIRRTSRRKKYIKPPQNKDKTWDQKA